MVVGSPFESLWMFPAFLSISLSSCVLYMVGSESKFIEFNGAGLGFVHYFFISTGNTHGVLEGIYSILR